MAKIIFIGGSGRSGTNILRKVFDKHLKVATLPFEYRFIIDPDGIVDFYNSYSASWSPYMADVKIKRLENLLFTVSRDYFIGKIIYKILNPINEKTRVLTPKRYSGWELEKHIPGFKKISTDLIGELRKFSYSAIWPGAKGYEYKPRMYYGDPKSKKQLAIIFRNYLSRVFESILKKTGKEVFAEDNTWNILFAKDLLDILPEAKIIHVFRDPRDVVASLVNQRWTPNDPKSAAIYLRDIMNRWFEIRDKLDKSRVMEIRFEEFISDPAGIMRAVCDFSGLEFEENMLQKVDLSRSNIGRWKEQFSEQEKQEISGILKDISQTLGY